MCISDDVLGYKHIKHVPVGSWQRDHDNLPRLKNLLALPFGGAAVAAFTGAGVAAAGDRGRAKGISVTGRRRSPSGPQREETFHSDF